jgi:hypothetical protein
MHKHCVIASASNYSVLWRVALRLGWNMHKHCVIASASNYTELWRVHRLKFKNQQATNRYLEVNLHLLSYGLFKRYLQKGEE